MGVVNVTPDSFSDGGRFFDAEAALAYARQLIADGADLLDIGGESTRPGAAPVSDAEQLRRVLPLIQALAGESTITLCIDTMEPAVARAAAAAGATIWNDVTALRHAPESMETAAELCCEVVLMHMQGEPRTMQADPQYQDVVTEVADFLMARAEAAMSAGVMRDRILIDPGLGFGKSTAHNLALLRHLETFTGGSFRVVLGASRKRFIRALDPRAMEAQARLGGSLAAALRGAEAGCAVIRVHDVRETVQALAVQTQIAAS